MESNKNHLAKVKIFHDHEAEAYLRQRYRDDSCEGLAYVTRKYLVLNMTRELSGKVLDLGCGPGILTSQLVEQGLEPYSIDLSLEMIKKAKNNVRYASPQIAGKFLVCEASNICFSSYTFDSVLCIGILYYIKDINIVIKEIKRTLKQDGIAILELNKIKYPFMYKTLLPLYRRIKAKYTGKNYDKMQFKGNIFSYKIFLSDIQKVGFCIKNIDYFDFRLPFIDVIFPNLSLKLGRFMFAHRDYVCFKLLARGMIIVIKKVE